MNDKEIKEDIEKARIKRIEKFLYYGDSKIRNQPRPIGFANYLNNIKKEGDDYGD